MSLLVSGIHEARKYAVFYQFAHPLVFVDHVVSALIIEVFHLLHLELVLQLEEEALLLLQLGLKLVLLVCDIVVIPSFLISFFIAKVYIPPVSVYLKLHLRIVGVEIEALVEGGLIQGLNSSFFLS